MPQPRLKYLLASSRCIQQATPQYRTPRDYRASVECSREAGQEDRAIVDVSESSTQQKGQEKRTFDVKCRPKAISSPCSSACLIALSRVNPPAAIHNLPAQIARRKSFDSQSTTRSTMPWTRGSMTCKYAKFGWRLRSSATKYVNTGIGLFPGLSVTPDGQKRGCW